jgi:Zn-dependent protease with chaperone function
MVSTGSGKFFNGKTSAEHDVAVELTADSLLIRAADGALLAEWPYSMLQHLPAPGDIFRLGLAKAGSLQRLEIRDSAFARAIDERSHPVDRSGRIERQQRVRVIAWSLAATVSLVLVALFGVPAIATVIAPLIPHSVEKRLGVAVDGQVRSMLDTNPGGKPFECGVLDAEKEGLAAFGKLMGKLETAARLPTPLKVAVVRRREPNAMALPGGHIYVFEGLITKSESADEVAGVLAHELGHVAHRDGTRSVLQAAGLSFMFGMLLGDFVGGGAVMIAARSMVQSSYTRDVERAADLYSVDLMIQAGGDPRALGTVLTRITGNIEPGLIILQDHPQTKDRVALINSLPGQKNAMPLLEPSEWAALKRICSG